jgi:hypothetical protein
MKFLVAALILVGLLSTLALSRETEATNNSLEDRVATLEATIDQFYEEFSVHEEHILALEDRVAQLEDAIDQQPEETDKESGSEWTEQDAVNLVYQALSNSLSGCQGYELLELRDCLLRDPVLTGFHDSIAGMPTWMLPEHIELIVQDVLYSTEWYATYEGEQSRWHVEVVHAYSGVIYPFYLDETTGLVVGDYAVTE